MCLPNTKDKEVNKRDIALAFITLTGIRKLEQVVTSVLSVTKGKEAQGTIAVLVPNLSCCKCNSVMVWK